MAHSKENVDKTFKKIIELIEDGLSLRKAVNQLGISTRTFYNWVEEEPIKQQQYARAIICRADNLFEEIIEIADDSSGDIKYTENGEVLNSEFVQRSKLRVDARKWALSKMNPKKYGDRVQNLNINTELEYKDVPEWLRPNKD
jgi:hypothetical protein